jgi:tRNA(Ile)-lysidine synthase
MEMATPSPALLTKLAADWPREKWRDLTVLVAVSGGADSVALARGLAELRDPGEGQLVVAHFNHQMRGAESDRDQAFVEQLGAELGVQVVAGRRGGERESGRGGEGPMNRSEESLREARYTFLAQAAAEVGARYVATAHTADDQAETVLHNILRGAGLAGVAGIPRLRPLTAAATLIRPLLAVTRAEVLEYLSALGQAYREDASNQSLDYKRNRIRHELLPLLERDYNPHVRAALRRLSKIADEAESLLDQQADELLGSAIRPAPGGVEIAMDLLEGRHPALVRQVLLVAWRGQGWPQQDMSFDKWEQLLAFARAFAANGSDPPPLMFPGGVRAERKGNVLRLLHA